MTPLPPDRRTDARRCPAPSRPALVLGALLAALVLAACGPGVGGTGTGEEPVGAQGARTANVCDSELGVLLGCRPSAPAGPLAPEAQDQSPLWYVDLVSGRAAVARFAAQTVQFELRCPALRFEGRWGQSPELGGRYFGTLPSEPAAPLASLRLQLDGTALLAQLFDRGGQPIGPPLRLVRVPAPPPPPDC